ncbi:transposase [Methylobacterium sp. SyP6R]|uniref:transposase n=1 Tax=Methylobacterium sp. SyP6R TaxID=2718876 RepID=UPI003FA5F17C
MGQTSIGVDIVAAIAWHLRVGSAWRALPAGFPPWRTVYGCSGAGSRRACSRS